MHQSPIPARGGRRFPLVTDDGFGEYAIVVDEATGSELWQGAIDGPAPTPEAVCRSAD